MPNIPGKTFLVGEYAVLVGGEALGLATKPTFSLSQEKTNYHVNSAVGLFSKKNNLEFNQMIINPYKVGGFGQSTAEFIFAWLKKNIFINSVKEIFNDYLNLYNSIELKKIKPSGADLIIQLLGHVTYFANPVENSKPTLWPFQELSFFIISTGLKIQTHKHLENLNRDCLEDLPKLSAKVIQSYFKKDQDEFLTHLKIWVQELQKLSLIHSDILDLKNNLEKNENISLVKPCGALGADVCIVFFLKDKKADVLSDLLLKNIQIQSDETGFSEGVIQTNDQTDQTKDLR